MPNSEQSQPPLFNGTNHRTAYSGPWSVKTFTPGEDMTKQSFKDECDINVIMKRYAATGILEHVREAAPRYLDATTYDYQAAMNLVAEANSLFAGMPSELRERFGNDPAKLLDFVHDPKNAQESVSLGFLDPALLPEGVLPAELPRASPAPSGATEGGEGGTPPSAGGKRSSPAINPLNA